VDKSPLATRKRTNAQTIVEGAKKNRKKCPTNKERIQDDRLFHYARLPIVLRLELESVVVTVVAVLGQGTAPSTGELETVSIGNDNTGVLHAYLLHCCPVSFNALLPFSFLAF